MDRRYAIAKRLHSLEEAQWMAPERVSERQFAVLANVLAHFDAHSSWFRERLRRFGLTPGVLSDPTSFRRLPPMTKREMRDAGQRLFSERLSHGHGKRQLVTTSGSTGEPTVVYRTSVNEIDWMALSLLEHAWHRRNFSKRECGIRIHGDRPISRATWTEPVSLFHPSGPSLLLPIFWDATRLADAVADFAPTYLQVFPSLLLGIIDALNHSRRCPSTPIEEVRVYGETFDCDARQQAAITLGTRITETYSCEEVGKIACQCPQGDFLHIISDLLLVEVLDEDDYPCSPGQIGRVIVTDLRNYATPLIRYEIGDYAEVGPACPCGRGMPTLAHITGAEPKPIASS